MTSLPMLLAVLSACALVGAMPALVTALKPHLQQHFSLDQQHVERLERRQFFLAWVAGMPLAGWIIDISRQPDDVLVAGVIGIAAILSFFAMTQSPRWLSAMSFLLGVATSFLVVATICLAPVAIPHTNCPAAALNVAFIIICLGSFTPQVIMPRLERWFGLRRALLGLGLGALLPVGFLLVAAVSGSAPEAPPAAATSADFFFDLRFWLLAGCLLLYYPIESALDIWSGPFLREIGYQERRARMMLVGFWLAFLGSRFAMWYLLGPRDEVWILWFCVLISAILLGNLVGAYAASSGGIGFWLVGACYGPLLPGFLGLLVEYFPASSGLAVGSVLAVAGLHDALAQPLMERGTQNRSVRIAMRIPLLMTLLILAPLLVVGLVKW